MEKSSTTTLWLETIRFELDALDDSQIIPPDEPVASSETIIGAVNDDIHRRLYTLSRTYSYNAAKCELEKRYGTSGVELGDLEKWNARAHILADLFWTEIRSQLPGYGSAKDDENFVGLRENWTIVTGKEKKTPSLGDLFKMGDS